jgi:hypothetical protein
MLNPDTMSAETRSLTESQNAIEALKRLRSSYKARPVTGADRAVLLAVKSTLKSTRNTQDPG